MCGGPADVTQQVSCRKGILRRLLCPTRKQGFSHCCACLPLGLRKWTEGHLGTSGGPEIPRGSHHPRNIPQSIMPGLPAATRVRSGEEGCPIHSDYPPDPLPCLVINTVWEPGGGPWGMVQPEGPLPESLAWPDRITHWLLSSISYSPDPPLSTPWTLGYQPGSCLVLRSLAYGTFALGLCDLSRGPYWLALMGNLVQGVVHLELCHLGGHITSANLGCRKDIQPIFDDQGTYRRGVQSGSPGPC